MRVLAVLSFVLTAMAAQPGMAQQGYGAPGSVVYQVNKTTFEVVGNSGRGYTLFWCGAARYARQVLGAQWKNKITIVRGLGNSAVTGRRSAVQFTLDPAALGIAEISSPSPNAYDVGDSKTVTSANGFCTELLFPWRF